MKAANLPSRGFSYTEILVAVVLLALCAVPAASAIKSGIDASTIAAAKFGELRCMRDQMELVLAEPYQNLFAAAIGKASYSKPGDGTCAAREVYIARYQHEYDKPPVFLVDSGPEPVDSGLLYIRVSSPATSYTFTTLVTR